MRKLRRDLTSRGVSARQLPGLKRSAKEKFFLQD
jgi:hypothetical protein